MAAAAALRRASLAGCLGAGRSVWRLMNAPNTARHRSWKMRGTVMRAASRATALHSTSALLPAAATRASPLLLHNQRRWNQQAQAESHIFDENDAFRRRLLYRSKQRGWLEMDLMLGSWVRAYNSDFYYFTRHAR